MSGFTKSVPTLPALVVVLLLAVGCAGSSDAGSGDAGPTDAGVAGDDVVSTPADESTVSAETPTDAPPQSDPVTPVPTEEPTPPEAEAPTPAPVVDTGLTQITVESTAADYFVLFVRPDLSAENEIPIAIVRGEDGSTTISDSRTQLPDEHYRVESFLVDAPEISTVMASTI